MKSTWIDAFLMEKPGAAKDLQEDRNWSSCLAACVRKSRRRYWTCQRGTA